MKIHIADNEVLARLLERNRGQRHAEYGVDLGLVLKETLAAANKLVPSESGSILLDDPLLKSRGRQGGRLSFVACFGRKSSSLTGTSISDRAGVAGETYRSGRPYISRDVKADRKFCREIDEMTGHKSVSIICAPVAIAGAPIGVIELINRKNGINYNRADLSLLEIFAGHAATLIHNALIGRSFEEISKTDTLTGLYNDRFFFRSLECEVAGCMRKGGDVGLIFFDLDRFKEVNDTHGHLAGSAVLKEVGGILRNIFAGTRAVLARYGGDEYVVVLPGMGPEEAARYAERIREGISGYTFLNRRTAGGPPLNIGGVVTCSLGVSSLSGQALAGKSVRQIVEAVIRAADRAMYVAKELGKNRVFVSAEERTG